MRDCYDRAVPRPNDEGGFRRLGRLAAQNGPGPLQRLLLAAIGLLGGDTALLMLLSPALSNAWDVLWLYVIFSVVGWVLVGLPVALLVPARLVSRISWLRRILIGATLGPLALLVIVVLLLVKQGRLREFSLANSQTLWPMSILVSTVSFLVYAALLRWRLSRSRAPDSGW